MTSSEKRLFEAFFEAAMFLKHRIEDDDWKQFSSNYLREHVRCRTGLKFSNSKSPFFLRELRKAYPELRKYIHIGTLKTLEGG